MKQWYEVKQDLKKRWNVSNLVSRFSLSTITMGRFKNRVYCQEAEDILPFANHPPHTDALLFDYQFEEAADNTLEHYY
ncbi:uncharacterized protein LOC120534041 isoform X3 [Polypterus senegalus]|uniref:uncharacterized protein LOC120534041 isoform X3 n=1 Tax=Polypterus senegalus TaxID=55291 RepID=UPI00196350EB|nr:uncharacterized protein LOC120534041 isoform X3 [Polypterus senegalus]